MTKIKKINFEPLLQCYNNPFYLKNENMKNFRMSYMFSKLKKCIKEILYIKKNNPIIIIYI